jgi:hypothetical protein
MVNPLINDGHLIGFWPLHESSGAASFHNYSPHLANKPSGLSFDLMVHNVAGATEEESRTRWPGSAQYTLAGTSGGPYVSCYKALGAHTTQTEHGRVLIAGEGGQWSRVPHFITPRIAQSGFTVGCWILPQSNGNLTRTNPRSHAKTHALLGIGESDAGWWLGVSGSLSQPAQIGELLPNNPSGLAGYIVGLHNNATPPAIAFHLNTPIESGHFTHLAFSYRVTLAGATTSNVEYVLYKDGRVAASGNTTGVTNNTTLTIANATYNIRALCVGGSLDETDTVDRYNNATGWGHYISGVYFFNRVLHEGELLALHGAGGLQPFEGVGRKDAQSVSLFDSKLVAYLPFYGPGHTDVSKNHYAFVADNDEGDEADFVTCAGPFGRHGLENFGATAIGLASTSGLMNELVAGKSFTLAGYFSLDNDAHAAATTADFANSLSFSLGEVGANSTGVLNTACFYLSTQNTNVRYLARFFPLGLSTTEVTELRGFDQNSFSEVNTHLAIVYDDQTRGVALYTNGVLQESGTLSQSLSPQFTKCAGSGYPLVVGNGIQSNLLADPFSPFLAPGTFKQMAEISIFSRPLLPAEILCLAQSGIDSTPVLRTVHDPRLMGYWRANTLDAQTMIVPDYAHTWRQYPANLVRSTNDPVWDNISPTTDPVGQGAWYRRDEFSRRYSVPAALAGQLPLGITSGVWTVHGGSIFDFSDATVNPNRNCSLSNVIRRFKPFIEDADLQPTTPYSYILSYEVVPSGNIRAHTVATPMTVRFNGLLHSDGNEAGVETFFSYLTNNAHIVGQPAGSSGVTVVFAGRDGATTFTNMASGNLSFGVPSRVLFHARFSAPYYLGDANGTQTLLVDLYINGIKVYTRTATASTLRLWSNNNPDITDDHIIQFGGVAGDPDNITKVANGETGLGEIYLRNMFIMKGRLSNDDVTYFAASGILDDPVLSGYTNQQITTPVDTNDANLQGYYRFSGSVSGERDLSTKLNHLTPLARIFATNDPPLFGGATPQDNPAHNLRFVPGPLLASDLGIQSSGITYNGNNFAPVVGGWIAPPYVASGEAFTRPDLGFSVGFWYVKRETFATTSGFMPLVSYGTMPTTATVPLNGVDYNRSWAIIWDSSENLRMVISQSGTGSMYMNPATASNAISGVVNCGLFTDPTDLGFGSRVNPIISNFNRAGIMRPGHLDCWNHALWSYNASNRIVTCYYNGVEVDRQHVSSGVNNPVDPTTRMISLFVPQVGPWFWMNAVNNNDVDTVLTDLCYFDAPITAAQAKYIAYFGIDAAVGTETSGVIGGFVHGQDTGSGLIGGWFRGHDSASGLIGGYSPGGTLGSGEPIGGYVSGIIFAEGTLGGFVRGMDTGSGIIAGFILGSDLGSGRIGGYVRGLDTGSGIAAGFVMGGTLGSGSFGGYIPASALASGIVGGFITGGLQGFFSFDSSYTVEVLAAKDFDSQLEIAKTTTADFDAKLIIFQDEAPPLVAIEIPSSTVTGLVPPFNQYFIGRASGTQGKTITQTRWNFGDFTPTVAGSLSGTSHYPIQHRFAGSGFYIVKFEAIDSNGLHASDTRIINAVSGVDPTIISLSGVPRSGNAALIVDFDTNVDILPPGVSIITQLLNFDDGQTTTAFDPTHAYTEPGTYKPLWIVRDSRGIIWSDGLKMGSDILTGSED